MGQVRRRGGKQRRRGAGDEADALAGKVGVDDGDLQVDMVAATGVEESRQPVAREIEVADDELDRLLSVDDRFEAIDEAKDERPVSSCQRSDMARSVITPQIRQSRNWGSRPSERLDPLTGVGPADERDRSQTAIPVRAGERPVVGGASRQRTARPPGRW